MCCFTFNRWALQAGPFVTRPHVTKPRGGCAPRRDVPSHPEPAAPLSGSTAAAKGRGSLFFSRNRGTWVKHRCLRWESKMPDVTSLSSQRDFTQQPLWQLTERDGRRPRDVTTVLVLRCCYSARRTDSQVAKEMIFKQGLQHEERLGSSVVGAGRAPGFPKTSILTQPTLGVAGSREGTFRCRARTWQVLSEGAWIAAAR